MPPEDPPDIVTAGERYIDHGEVMAVAFAARYLTVNRGTLTAFAWLWEEEWGQTAPEDIPGFTDVYLWRQHSGTSLALTLSSSSLLTVGAPFLLKRNEEEDPPGWKVKDQEGDVWTA